MSDIVGIRDFVVDQFLFGDDEGITVDTKLFEEGIVDSTGILEIVAFIEEQYAVSVADDELVPANFETLGAIAQYVETKNGKGADQPKAATLE
jgi:acyl carrier protein